MIWAELEEYPDAAWELKCEGKGATCTIQVITSFGIRYICTSIHEYRKDWREERKGLKLTTCGVWLGTMHWTFNFVIYICILFDIYEPWFGFSELYVPVFSSHESYVKEYFVGRYICLLRHNALHGIQFGDCGQGTLLLWSNIFCICARPTWEQSMFLQRHKARQHSRSGCLAVHSRSAYITQKEIWRSCLKFLPEKNLGESYLETFCLSFCGLSTLR